MPLIAIMLVLAVYLADDLAAWPFAESPLGTKWRLALSLLAFALVVGIAGLIITVLSRRLRRKGSVRAAVWADRLVGWTTWVLAGVHLANIVLLHWVQAVRDVVGDIVIVDELLAVLPVLLAFVAIWWLHYPMQRRIREASMLRRADSGATVYPIWTRRQYVLMQARFHFGLILPPVFLILAWSESVDRLWPWGSERIPAADLLGQVLVLLGAIGVFVFAPLLVRHLWDTMPLPPGPLRDGLEAMCRRHGIRVRAILIWRTWGGMINGAVMGLLGRFRYILLTDALLDHLQPVQVQAVMAHELGHVRRRHMPWLALSLVAIIGASGSLVTLGAVWAANRLDEARTSATTGSEMAAGLSAFATTTPAGTSALVAPDDQSTSGRSRVETGITESFAAPPLTPDGELITPAPVWLEPLIIALTFGTTMFGLGWCSRRFERQADTFAVQHLSGLGRREGGDRPVTHESVVAMVTALQLVADLNHIPVRRRSWRHGSIRSRQKYLFGLVGKPCGRLRIDRMIALIKLSVLVLFIATLVLQYLLTR